MLIVRQELIAKQQDSALAHEPPQRTDDGFRDCVTAGQVQTADFGSGLPRKRAHGKTRIGTRNGLGAKHLIGRSEEHTSELQSLMRISYAVFCLKKKKNHR